tara:strand:+ start:68 stop:1018 length:951 start_codon:yes stop_codon:yes gene_type:complete
MGANKDPKALQIAVSQLAAAKQSREERAGANERREAKPTAGGPSGGGSDDWLGDFYRDNNIGGRGGSLDEGARDYWTKEAETRGKDAVMDTIRGTAKDQGTWGGPRKPMPEKPPRDEPKFPGRPPGGRGDVRIQPFPYPPRGDDQFGPGSRPLPGFPGRPPTKTGRPIGDDQFPVGEDPIGLFPIPGRPPKKPFPGRPDKHGEGRPQPPVEEHPWGREDDPNYGRKKDAWHQKRRDENRRRMEFKRQLMKRRGGIDFGPGRGGRVDRDVTRKQIEAGTDAPVSSGEFISPEEGLKGQEYMAFMERLLRQKQGQFDR